MIRRTLTLAVLLLAPVSVNAAEPVGKWLGQDGHDVVGGEPGTCPSEYQDIHFAIKGLPSDRAITEVVIRGDGGGEWKTTNNGRFTIVVVRKDKATSADLYVEPYQRETGRGFDLHITLDNGRKASLRVDGGKADPNLRMPGTGVAAKWLGQDGQDRMGSGTCVGPDGVEDIHIAIEKLTSKVEIKAVEVTSGSLAWSSGMNPKGNTGLEFVRRNDDRSRGDLYFNPARDTAKTIAPMMRIVVHYADDRVDQTYLTYGKFDPAKAMPKVAAPTLAESTAKAKWLGQDGVETSPGDAHVLIEGLPGGKTIVAAALSDGVAGAWMFRADDKVKFEAGPNPDRLNLRRPSPTTCDLVFPPYRDEAGATMTLRLMDQDGRQQVLRFPGGSCTPDRRATPLPIGSVTARPGDDLQAMVEKAGTVTLSPGVYPMAKPLILSRPVRIVGEAGSTLKFTQGSDQPPWTAAIKIHAGGTTLEGFAVRFDGPVRWDKDVSFGPALIGTTDDRDRVPNDLKFKLTLSRLDLQAPVANSSWEPAPGLIRFIHAGSGRIERNTLKGGTVLFGGGPWTITGNDYRGTMPGTFSYCAFSGRSTHDLILSGNHAKGDAGPSGKTWRFLVLTQKGVNDVIKDNVVEGGIGPREDDPKQHDNSPEVILTEAYRLHFEGKPTSISKDGRLLVIPNPQGGAASTGDAVAILSGPQAGQWRTVAQPLGPNAYLLDEPIALETDGVSIASGFVRETFEGNLVDCRGSGISAPLVLAGNLFGVKIVGNKFLGGGETVRLLASPTEEPVQWGWSHTLFLGGLFERNIVEDSAKGGGIGVEHGQSIKSNKGRVYMTIVLKDNTFRWTSVKAPRMPVSFGPCLDPKELLITESGTKIEGASPEALWVHAATINGKVVQDAPLTGRGTVGAKSPKGGRNE